MVFGLMSDYIEFFIFTGDFTMDGYPDAVAVFEGKRLVDDVHDCLLD